MVSNSLFSIAFQVVWEYIQCAHDAPRECGHASAWRACRVNL